MKKLRLVVKERKIYFPTLKLPLVNLGVSLPLNFKFKLPSLEGLNFGKSTGKIIGFTFLFSALVISGAIYFAIRGVNAAPLWPESASYDAHRAQRLGLEKLEVGEEIPADVQTGTMTLQLNIGGARIEHIKFSDMSIGKASDLTDAIKISASSGVIICEKLEFIDVEATDFTMATSTAYSMKISTTTADGLSISPTLSSDAVKYAFGSTRGALSVPAVSGGTFDRIIISSNATSTVGTISFERVKAYGAGITVSDVNCGEITVAGTDAEESIYGDGTGIDSASFTITDTVKVQSSTLTNNVERPVSVK